MTIRVKAISQSGLQTPQMAVEWTISSRGVSQAVFREIALSIGLECVMLIYDMFKGVQVFQGSVDGKSRIRRIISHTMWKP